MTATSTVAPDAAVQLAERYGRSGGLKEVHGIQLGSSPDGVPLLVVWTHNPKDGAKPFDHLKTSMRDEELSVRDGYLLDVYGPGGALQHRFDARP